MILLQCIFKKNQSQKGLLPYEQEKIAVSTCFYDFKPAVPSPHGFEKTYKKT